MVVSLNYVGISALIFLLFAFLIFIIPEEIKSSSLFFIYFIILGALFLNMCIQGYRFDSAGRKNIKQKKYNEKKLSKLNVFFYDKSFFPIVIVFIIIIAIPKTILPLWVKLLIYLVFVFLIFQYFKRKKK